MTNKEDNFEWARRLECPASNITDPVRKFNLLRLFAVEKFALMRLGQSQPALNDLFHYNFPRLPQSIIVRYTFDRLDQGLSSLLWDELAGLLYPAEEVRKIRKNILLYKLKNGEKDQQLRHIESTVKLREARSLLEPRIESLEEKCEEHDFIARQKQQSLGKIKSQRRLLKIKEDLLRMKLNEMNAQVEDCREMRSVCQHLMPANNCQIDSNIVDESLALVSNMSTRADRKMVLNKISESLGTIDISILWNILLTRRTRDTEDLIALGTREMTDKYSKSGESMDTSISRARGRYIATAVQEQIYCAKNNVHEKQVVEYIEKIESHASEANSMYVGEWLALNLEVCKLETEQKALETEIEHLKETLEQQYELGDELSNLECEIHSIHTKMENCIQDIQKSLVLLKPAGSEITQTREKLLMVLQKIVALREERPNANYLDIDPSMELSIFHDTVQLEALDKIVLKDNVGSYRHRKFCISEALHTTEAPSLANSTSLFPMIRIPVYQLLDCYKSLVTASWLTKLESESNTNEHYDSGEWIDPIAEETLDDSIEILNVTDSTCDRVREEINRFNSIFDAWKYQTVEKAMTLDDTIVAGASFKEWVKRYDIMLHMIRKKK